MEVCTDLISSVWPDLRAFLPALDHLEWSHGNRRDHLDITAVRKDLVNGRWNFSVYVHAREDYFADGR
jgi:hypothetical protein